VIVVVHTKTIRLRCARAAKLWPAMRASMFLHSGDLFVFFLDAFELVWYKGSDTARIIVVVIVLKLA
jgi:hypothetical protein